MTFQDMTFQELKIFILDITDLSRDAMHMHVGLAIFMLVWLLWRWRGARLLAWLAALCAALTGEYLDHPDWATDVMQSYVWDEHWKDIFSTMLWPTILALFIGALPYVRRKKKEIMRNDINVSEDD